MISTVAPVLVLGLAGLLFVILPVASARSGAYKRTLSVLLVVVACFFYLSFLASHRIVIDRASPTELESGTFGEGILQGRESAQPFARVLLGPILGLAILSLVPRDKRSVER